MQPFKVKESLVNAELFEALDVIADDHHHGPRYFAVSLGIGRDHDRVRAEPLRL